MSHIYQGQDPESPPPVITGQGAWVDIQIPDDSDYRDAQSSGVGLEGLADRTNWLRRRIHLLTQTGTINQLVPDGLSGSTLNIWTTPIAPYIVEGATFRITGTATGSTNPATVQFDLAINSKSLIVGLTSNWTSATYTVDGTTINKVFWGFKSADWGELLDGSLSDQGRDLVGVQSESGRFICLASGTNGLMNKLLTLQIRHGGVSPITLNIPYEVRIIGRLLL